MKKVLSLILVMMIVPLILVGCNDGKLVEEGEISESQKGETEALVEEADLIVIGGGGSGMSAALEASKAGAKVVILEKMNILGGNTIRSTGGYNAIGTDVQVAEGIDDNKEIYLKDVLKEDSTDYERMLAETFADNSLETYNWLKELGLKLTEVANSAGNSVKRLHRPEGGAAIGVEIVKLLKETVMEDEHITVALNTSATKLITGENGSVVGVEYKTDDGKIGTIKSKAVIIATGSYGNNPELIEKYRPDLKESITTNHPGATGEGILMAEEIGAELYNMDDITIHPTVNVDKGLMISEGVRGSGAIVVNTKGERFIAEGDPSNAISKAIFNQDDSVAFVVFDQGVRDNMAAIENYIKQGLIVEANSLEELAEEVGIKDGTALIDTVEKYNIFASNKKDDDFDRQNIEVELKTGPYYATKIAPAIHGVKGGIKINERTEVLGTDGNVIEALFSSGECTGGVRGVADSIIFGRIAGKSALELIK